LPQTSSATHILKLGARYTVSQYGEFSILLLLPGESIVKSVMALVFIPKLSFFTLYARGLIQAKHTENSLGTFIRFEGVVLLYYKYPHHRRAYMVRSHDELAHYPAVSLPNVKPRVGVLYRAKGRRIDLLRNTYWNLEQINGKSVYAWDTLFWQKISCLVDTYNGRKSAAIKSNLMALSKEYRLRHDR
jgi:hypothetical protein